MVGISSYSAYVPRYFIDRKTIYKAVGWLNPATYLPGKRAVANYDEDSLTMAVASGMACLSGRDRSGVDAVLFATTTSPYCERQGAEIIATSLDLRADIRTADLTDALKSGTTAMALAVDTINGGSAKKVLICAADCRCGKPGSSQEELFGDGAAAVLMEEGNVIARYEGAYSVSYDFVDHWRSTGDRFDRQWEDRFIRDEGYSKFIIEVLTGLARKYSIDWSSVAKVIYPNLYPSDFQKITRAIKLSPSQVAEPLAGEIGYMGTADPLVHLIKVLENSKAGDRIIVVGFGNGADSVLFEVTSEVGNPRLARRGLKSCLAARRELDSYEKMITFKGILDTEKGIRGETVAFTALSDLWRSRHQVLGLCGSRCRICGTPQFPAQKICVNPDCGAIDQMEFYRFSDKRGTLFTYTGDHLAFSPNPPAIYGMVDFDGGGRYWFDITDADLKELKVGMPVEMSFRRKYVDSKLGVHGYFWKAVPAFSEKAQDL
jgi:hydroxymethylglutaryl-CoA synthase